MIGLIILQGIENKAQIANYVNNGGFENVTISASLSPSGGVDYWSAIDSTKGAFYLFSSGAPNFNAPYSTFGFQFPRTGNNYIGSEFYCHPSSCGSDLRWYPKNRLKQKLKLNTVYCAKYFIVNTNNNVVGIDNYEIYLGNNTLDTIKKCFQPLTYLIPQIENQNGIIPDTLNWVPITGTFVADGTEKYMVLGNFKSSIATSTMILNPTHLPNFSNDIWIDDVSLIERDLPAYAGPDKYVNFGDSVFLGRQPDVGIDEACMWFQLPTVITPTPPIMDTVAGLWVKPVVTTTYVVRQQLWCSGVKWDTVVVYMNALGLKGLQIADYKFQIWPNPADNVLVAEALEATTDLIKIQIYNNLGQVIKEEELQFKNKKAEIRTADLPNGVYLLLFKNSNSETSSKRFVINR